MKICFVGIGSIARRHAKNLRSICKEQGIMLTIDALRRPGSKRDDEGALFDQVFYFSESLPNKYDAIFITNPTEYHLEALETLNNYSNCFFVEKPVATLQQRDKIEQLVRKQGKLYYVACPIRYTAVISYLKSNVVSDRIYGVRCISSSYLPDWRPGTDYRKTYSASKEMGGGVSIDLIHEWDYIKYLFGMPKQVFCMKSKLSNLEIDCEDYASYIAEYSDKVVELHLDYFGRKTIREIMIFEEDDTIIGDLVNSTVHYLKSGKKIEFNENRDDYQKRELMTFLNLMQCKDNNMNNIEDAYRTLKLTQGIVEG